MATDKHTRYLATWTATLSGGQSQTATFQWTRTRLVEGFRLRATVPNVAVCAANDHAGRIIFGDAPQPVELLSPDAAPQPIPFPGRKDPFVQAAKEGLIFTFTNNSLNPVTVSVAVWTFAVEATTVGKRVSGRAS